MAEILKGAPVAQAIADKASEDVLKLKDMGIEPCLAILRVGERPDDLAYEKGATKKAEKIGVKVLNKVLPEDVSQEDMDKALTELNEDTFKDITFDDEAIYHV